MEFEPNPSVMAHVSFEPHFFKNQLEVSISNQIRKILFLKILGSLITRKLNNSHTKNFNPHKILKILILLKFRN